MFGGEVANMDRGWIYTLIVGLGQRCSFGSLGGPGWGILGDSDHGWGGNRGVSTFFTKP